MKGGPKTLIVVLVALLLAVGPVACGGGDSSSSTTTEADEAQAEGKPSGGTSKQNDATGGDQAGESGEEGKPGSSGGPSASDFVPKSHSDSGGGSQQFVVKGGDNSIQEFGAEADTSELDAAAVALHNFLDARAEGNWAAACEYMSQGIVESFEKLASQSKQHQGSSCAGILEALTNPGAASAMKAEAEKANVRSLRTEGEQAFVIYTGLEGTILAMAMANEDGTWKVASLAGTPLN